MAMPTPLTPVQSEDYPNIKRYFKKLSTYPFVCFLCRLVKTSLPDYYSNYRKERGEVKTGENEMEGKKKIVIHKLLGKFKQTEI